MFKMKILKLKVNNFFLCKDDLNISFMPISKKTLEDKEYELLEIAPELYVYNSVAFIGKNASGKTTLLRLLNMVYEILSFFRIENFKYLISKTMTLELFFYHENKIYFYKTNILNQKGIIKFNEEEIYYRTYNKTALKNLFDLNLYTKMEISNLLPEDTSALFNVFKKVDSKILYYSSDDYNLEIYFNIYKLLGENKPIIIKDILQLFDEHITNIELTDNDFFKITYFDNSSETLTQKELNEKLSSGTEKGIALFVSKFI